MEVGTIHTRRTKQGGKMGTVTIDATAIGNMTENALAFCARKVGLRDAEEARRCIKDGECVVCGYLTYALSKHIGEYLGSIDSSVQAVYSYEPDYPTGGFHLDGHAPAIDRGMNLIVSVDRKNAALTSIVASLEDAVREAMKPLACSKATASCHGLDVKMADAREVTSRRGYGALLSSLHAPPLLLWARSDQP